MVLVAWPTLPGRGSSPNRESIRSSSRNRSTMPSPCVPDSCRIVLDRRFLIEEPLEAVKAEVLELLDELTHTRPGFRYQIRDVMEFVPTMTEKDAPVVQAVASGIRAVLGKEPESSSHPEPATRSMSSASGTYRSASLRTRNPRPRAPARRVRRH